MTPRDGENGPVYDVSGDIDLFGGDRAAIGLIIEATSGRKQGRKKRVMQVVVARDGFVQHYTPLHISISDLVLRPAS